MEKTNDGLTPMGRDIEALANLGARASEVAIFDVPTKGLGEGLPPSVPVIWNRTHGALVSLRQDINAWRLRPQRREGTAHARTLESFIELSNRHKDEHSAIFADTDWRAPKLTCVVNYHEKGKGEPRHGDHRIVYDFPITDEWKTWMEANGQVMDQGEFAAFVEDRIAELASPFDGERSEYERLFQTKFATPSELMQLSRGLQVRVGTNVKSARTLQSGEAEVVFEESHTDAAGNKLMVPGLFMLSVPAFFQDEAVRIPVRLRYRAGPSIKWFFQMYRADQWVTERIRADLDKAAAETKLPAYEGSPERG